MQKMGLSYERKVHATLKSTYPRSYGGGQWIKFLCPGSAMRWAQPDGLLLDWKKSQITIVEIKLSHDIRAWWGLRELYEPLVKFLFGDSWRVAVCEVCRFFDPATPWPEPLRFTRDPMDLRPGEFGIHRLDLR